MQSVRRQIITAAARRLAEDAQAEAAGYPMDSPQQRFYSGVERAAEDAQHMDLALVHGSHPEWLQHEPREFREGYLKAQALLVATMTRPEPPLRVPLPAFE